MKASATELPLSGRQARSIWACTAPDPGLYAPRWRNGSERAQNARALPQTLAETPRIINVTIEGATDWSRMSELSIEGAFRLLLGRRERLAFGGGGDRAAEGAGDHDQRHHVR